MQKLNDFLFLILPKYTQQSHHQLQDALDLSLATQALVHIMHFDIYQSNR